MRALAIARFRYLASIRRGTGVLVTLLILTTAFVLGPMNFAIPDRIYERWPVETIRSAAAVVFLLYAIFAVVLGSAALFAFGTRGRHETDATASDLFDTAPVSASVRFWGDAIGVFQACMAVHVATLPIIALAFAVTPWNLRVFIALEAFTVLSALLVGCAASWTMRARSYRWSLTRALRSGAIFAIALFGILMATTDWETFRDAATQFFDTMDLRLLPEVVAAWYFPAATILLLIGLYVGFIAFYFTHSLRSGESA